MSRARVVVIGASIGGVRTAQALRGAGYSGDVVLVGDEPGLPYDRPPLSKAVLSGARAADDLALITAEQAGHLGLTLMLGRRAERLHVETRQVELDGGELLCYDDVVVATGARARPLPWLPLGVHLLRTRSDAQALRADLLAGGHLVVVGAGFIGAEVAATARSQGVEVTLVDSLPAPMSRVLSAEVGEIFTSLHRRHGVATRFGAGVEHIDGQHGALRVALTNGVVLNAATVVVGIGAEPNDKWLATSGLAVEDGLVCDEFCRAVGAPRVHGVGDVARWWHRRHGEYIRVEHWTNAVEQAAAVAHNITYRDTPRSFVPVEYVWSDQYDWRIQIAGRTTGRPAGLVGDVGDGRFAVLYQNQDGVLAGLVTVNWPQTLIAGRRGIAAGASLADFCDSLEFNRGVVAAC